MKHRQVRAGKRRGTQRAAFRVAGAALIVLWVIATANGQTPQEHEQHHPSAPAMPSQPPTAPPAQPSSPSPAAPMDPSTQGSGMMGGMGPGQPMGGMGGAQLCCGGAPPPSPLYPSLMAVPELTPERRQQFERQAAERMAGGTAMMTEGFAQLAAATQARDAAAMEQANVAVREGLAQFESGLALRRALDEDRAPRDVALGWFRREMNLVPLTNSPPPHGFFGLSWFHYIVMFVLTAFAITMIGMYFNKMRRAEALVARLAGVSTASAPVVPSPLPSAPSATAIVSTPAEPTPPVNPEIAPSRPNSWTGLLRVARIFDETPTVKTFRLIDPLFGKLPFTYLPGQFVTVTVSIGDQVIKRSYTISSSPTERDYCEITVKREERGAVSQFLHDQVHEDDTLQITGPSGRFTFVGEEATSIVLIGGGVGVTPMMSVARYLTKRSWLHDIYFVFAVRGATDIIFREELDYLQHRYRNLHVIFVLEEAAASDTRYVKGRITRELLESRIPDLRTSRVHICGPPPMMNAVKALLTDIGVPADQIWTEVFQGKEQPRPKLAVLPAAEAKVAVVTFAKSNRTAMMPPTKTVLEAAEDVGVNIEYSCRIGICGVCRTKLLSGTVTQEVQDGLEPGDTENNIILACQAKSTADVSVDA